MSVGVLLCGSGRRKPANCAAGGWKKISTGRRYFDLIVTFCIFLCVWNVGLRDPVVVVEAVWFCLQLHYMAVRHVLVGCS